MVAVNEGRHPRVRRIGSQVYLEGTAEVNTVWSEHDSIITIPDGFRPITERSTIQSMVGTYRYKLSVRINGACKASNITNNENGNTETKKGYVIDFCDTWVI